MPTATHEESLSEWEASKEEEGEELDNDDDDTCSDEEVRMPMKKNPVVTPRKSSRLAFEGKRPMVSLDDYSSSHTTLEPQPLHLPPQNRPHHLPITYHHLHLFLLHLHQQIPDLLHHFHAPHQVLVLLVSLIVLQFLWQF